MNDSDPIFQARPSTTGQPWCVHVVWRSGQTEVVTGFETQYGALDWIRDKSANWLVERILKDSAG
jgi:hypothetical protein